MRTGVAGCVLLISLLAPWAAASDEPIGPRQRLARAEVCYAALDFACAEEELAEARKGMDELQPGERASVLRLSAEAALSLRQPAEARTYLTALCALLPDFAPAEGAWPRPWLAVLEEARAAAPDGQPPDLVVALPVAARAGEPVAVEVKATDRSGVAGVTLFVQTASAVVRIALTTTDGKHWRGTIPGLEVMGDAVLLFVEAIDQKGNGPARWGSQEDPRRVPIVAPAPSPSVVTKWWFWTAIGGAVAAIATGVTVYVLTRDDSTSSPEAAEPATGGIRPRWIWP